MVKSKKKKGNNESSSNQGVMESLYNLEILLNPPEPKIREKLDENFEKDRQSILDKFTFHPNLRRSLNNINFFASKKEPKDKSNQSKGKNQPKKRKTNLNDSSEFEASFDEDNIRFKKQTRGKKQDWSWINEESNKKTTSFKILNVGEKANLEEIKKSYHSLSKKWHPDRNPNNLEEATKKFQEIAQAYEELTKMFENK